MIIEYLLFIGMWLYFLTFILFLYLFYLTTRVRDGIGLIFLRVLCMFLSLGSLSIFFIRYFSEYGNLDFFTARGLAVINPLLLIAVALYLNYLFHNKVK